MAVTWIGAIRHTRLDHLVNYATNPTKTAYEGGRENAPIDANIAYALNPEKGTTRLYKSAHNCTLETALQEMRQTKERYEKKSGVMGYHIVQSFKPGEVDPEIVHRIGQEFVEKCFPDFEAVIGTHLDKQHIHNHIVVNSVSFVTGMKYRSNIKSYYAQIRAESDRLCKANGLSVVRNPSDGNKAVAYAQWQAEQQGRPTWTSAIKEDVDLVLARSRTFDHFVRQLREMGYAVKTEAKHMAVRPPGKERFTRLRRLGEDYTEEAIRRRIIENDARDTSGDVRAKRSPSIPIAHVQPPTRGRYRGRFPLRRSKIKGFRALYLWYVYHTRPIRKNPSSSKRIHYLFREDIYLLDKRLEMTMLLCKNKIDSKDELDAYAARCTKRIEDITQSRKETYREPDSHQRSKTLDAMKSELTSLRRQVRLCGEIEHHADEIRKKRDALRHAIREQQKNEVKKNVQRRRSR